MQSIQALKSKENILGARYLASHSQHALPWILQNSCAQDYHKANIISAIIRIK